MSFLNKNNKKISFESSELISELKNDITEFGENITLYVWYKIIAGVKIYVNYDFIIDDNKNESRGAFKKIRNSK